MVHIKYPAIIVLILTLAFPAISLAQVNGDLPIYIVQPGENLTAIAEKFHISLEELIVANNISDINLISAGTELMIPGLEGVKGILTAEPIKFGETYLSILRKFDLSQQTFSILNPITSPNEIFTGSTMVLPLSENQDSEKFVGVLDSNGSLLSSGIKTGMNYWMFSEFNQLNESELFPNERFYYKSVTENTELTPINSRIEVNPLPIVQGHTVVVKIYAQEPLNISGRLGDKELHFFDDKNGGFFYALSGLSAIAEPGLIPLSLTSNDAGNEFAVEQNLLLVPGGYQKEELTVEQTTIEQDVVETENAQIESILQPVTTEKLWSNKFRFPVDGSLSDDSIGFSSYFGNRRSYNNGSFTGYHGGLDFKVVLMSLNIYAPANGKVVFAGPMSIRGNATFIDHGQGVYSGYGHQSEFKVSVGDIVEEGQIIGIIGQTGRVTGPHLHWDIWVNGNQVDPFDWVDNEYP